VPELASLTAAHRQFQSTLDRVGADQWSAATPCAGWSVLSLVEHVVVGEHATVSMLDGATAKEALANRVTVTPQSAAAQYREVAAACEEAFGAPGALTRTVHHMVGDVPGEQVLGMRIGDNTVHAWDLARAIGSDETLDPALVAALWAQLQPMAPFIASIGVFGEGPSGTVPEDADLQRRLLDLTGRRP
jgi:uncharacterized protein (TIGR03086 family)